MSNTLPPGLSSDMPSSLPIARYRFTAQLRQSLRLPDYAGSLLRGQFGAALRHLACMTRQPSCGGCPLQASCPYTRIFEALPPPDGHKLQAFSAIPNAYVVEPPPPVTARPPAGSPHPAQYEAGQELVFYMVLAGAALEQLALVIYAWQRVLAHGLTKNRSMADLAQVEWVDSDGAPHLIWSAGQPRIAKHPAWLYLPPAPETNALQLHIHTPMRLQQQGHPIRPAHLTPRALLATLARRVALVLEFHVGQPQWGDLVPGISDQVQQLHDSRELHWFDWVRYSSRQRQEMTLGGVLGRWVLHGSAEILASAWPWLWLGQWLHVGKNASFGMGGYVLEQPLSPFGIFRPFRFRHNQARTQSCRGCRFRHIPASLISAYTDH